jgi:hypothetical protein
VSFNYSNTLTLIGIGFTIVVGGFKVVPRLSGSTRHYYLFLLAWTVPYFIGQICQEDRWGSIWMQYHLVDLSYIQSSTAFGAALYVAIAALKKWNITQSRMIFSMGVLFFVSVAVSYVGEVWDTCWAWFDYGSLASAIDWSDYLSFTVGLALAAIPCSLFPRIVAGTPTQ